MEQKQSLVKLTKKAIEEVRISEMVDLDPVRNNWVNTYKKTTGREDGELRYENEKVLFIKSIEANTMLQSCDKFSAYQCWMQLCLSGLSLNEGMAHLVPFNGKMVFMPGWKGRMQQLNDIPGVVFVHEPQCVYDCDEFQYELGTNPRVIKHIPGERKADSKITTVYFVIDYVHGPKTMFMEAIEIEKIRNKYSQAYKQYVADKAQADESGWVHKKKRSGEPYSYKLEEPAWVSSESEMFKKTIVHRAWKNQPNKLGRHIALDSMINKIADEATLEDLQTKADAKEPEQQSTTEPTAADVENAYKQVTDDIEDIEHEDVTDKNSDYDGF